MYVYDIIYRLGAVTSSDKISAIDLTIDQIVIISTIFFNNYFSKNKSPRLLIRKIRKFKYYSSRIKSGERPRISFEMARTIGTKTGEDCLKYDV